MSRKLSTRSSLLQMGPPVNTDGERRSGAPPIALALASMGPPVNTDREADAPAGDARVAGASMGPPANTDGELPDGTVVTLVFELQWGRPVITDGENLNSAGWYKADLQLQWGRRRTPTETTVSRKNDRVRPE